MRMLFRVLADKSWQPMGTLTDAGWRSYVPCWVYEYIVKSFLLPMSRLFQESDNEVLLSQRNPRGHLPFSLDEFHDIIAEEYVKFLNNGDMTKRAIVYHTTPSKRNRNVGWYHKFEYSSHPIPIIPDPQQQNQESAQTNKKQPDYFWPGLCKIVVSVPVPAPTGVAGVEVAQGNINVYLTMSVGHILIGKMVVTHFPNVLGTMKAMLGHGNDLKRLYDMKITNDHSVADLWPKYDHFVHYVKNCMKKTLKWELYPFTSDSLSQEARLQLLAKYEVCRRYKVEGNQDVIEQQLLDEIRNAMTARKLIPLLTLGSQVMNCDLALFLIAIREYNDQKCAQLCTITNSSQKVTSSIRKEWTKHDGVIPEIF